MYVRQEPAASSGLSTALILASSLPPGQHPVRKVLEEQAPVLLATIRAYIHKFTCASGEEAAALALEVLQETAVEALAHAERYLPTHPVLATCDICTKNRPS